MSGVTLDVFPPDFHTTLNFFWKMTGYHQGLLLSLFCNAQSQSKAQNTRTHTHDGFLGGLPRDKPTIALQAIEYGR
jgi:hypothetical protein